VNAPAANVPLKFNVAQLWDRLARNAEDLLRLVRELTGRGVTIKFEKEHLTLAKGQQTLRQAHAVYARLLR